MIDRADVDRLADDMDKVIELTNRELTRFWGLTDLSNPQAVRNDLIELIPALVDRYGDVAGEVALEWYENVRAKVAGLPRYSARLADGMSHDDVVSSTRWAAGALWGDDPDQTLRVLQGSLDRWVKYAGRATIARNIADDPANPRWAHVPSGAKTCAFCTMLASRGWVYHSKDTAIKAHAHCRCYAVPKFDPQPRGGKNKVWRDKETYLTGYDPDRYYRLYREAVEKVGYISMGTTKERENLITSAMRRLHPDQYTDGAWGKLPGGVSADGSLQAATWEQYRRKLAVRRPPDADPDEFPIPPATIPSAPADWPDDLPGLSDKAWAHILYGETTRKRSRVDPHHLKDEGNQTAYVGGHMHRYNWVSGGTPLPTDWTEWDIRDAMEHVLRDKKGDGAFSSVYRGINLQVVVVDGKIRTAHPLR